MRKLTPAWTVPIIEDEDGELYFELPDTILEQLNLCPGDTIIWEQHDKDTWILRKPMND